MKCACGRPLHYSDLALKVVIDDYVAKLGPEIVFNVGGRRYAVQRHYAALHGFRASEAESLADQGIIRRL